ncbi:MAG: hypothetical protein ACI9H6_000381, partial [Patiriisocius sp.]
YLDRKMKNHAVHARAECSLYTQRDFCPLVLTIASDRSTNIGLLKLCVVYVFIRALQANATQKPPVGGYR